MSPAQQESRLQQAVSEGSVQADSTAAAAVLRAVHQVSKSPPLSARELERIQLVVEELVTNIVTHGLPPVGSRIGFRFERTVRSMRIEITDRAAPFDPRAEIQTRRATLYTQRKRAGWDGL